MNGRIVVIIRENLDYNFSEKSHESINFSEFLFRSQVKFHGKSCLAPIVVSSFGFAEFLDFLFG